MSAEEKIKTLRTEIQSMSNAENAVKKRIEELKQLVAEKKKRVTNLETLKQQEQELLAQLDG